jgi:hypothetical protein
LVIKGSHLNNCYTCQIIQELYRIAADDIGWVTAREFIALLVIALMVWAGAFQLTGASKPQMPHATGSLAINIKLAPVVLGALPITAALVAQFVSRPAHKMGEVVKVGSKSLNFAMRIDELYGVGQTCG